VQPVQQPALGVSTGENKSRLLPAGNGPG
jgi:hypothetical protein